MQSAPSQTSVRERSVFLDFLSRPGISDLICLGLVLLVSLAGVLLEPVHRDFWISFPLVIEVPLLCTALLLLSRSAIAARIAAVLHIVMLAASGLLAALSLFLIFTILLAGLGI